MNGNDHDFTCIHVQEWFVEPLCSHNHTFNIYGYENDFYSWNVDACPKCGHYDMFEH